MNNITLMGRICKDPELKYTQTQIPVTTFTLAVDREYGDATDFIPCVAWRQTAEFICKYFRKGSLIALRGTVQSRDYEDRNGNKRTIIEIVADRVYFTGEKREENKPATPNDDFEEITADEDVLPF